MASLNKTAQISKIMKNSFFDVAYDGNVTVILYVPIKTRDYNMKWHGPFLRELHLISEGEIEETKKALRKTARDALMECLRKEKDLFDFVPYDFKGMYPPSDDELRQMGLIKDEKGRVSRS